MKTEIVAFYTSVLLLIAGCVASDSREANMSENYDGDPLSYPIHVRLVQDGEAASQAFLAIANQDLADRTAYLKARLAPQIQVGRKQVVSGAGLSIVKGTTATATATVSTGLTGAVGDELEILLVGNAAFQYATYGGNYSGMIVQLSEQENGIGYTILGSQEFVISDRDLTAGFGCFQKGSISMLQFKTVATPGPVDIKIVIAFSGTGNTGDAGDLVSYRAIVNQYRTF